MGLVVLYRKLRQQKYNLNEDEIKPYFSLESVRNGLYYVANKLYGITLTELNNVSVYEPDVKVYEVKDADGAYLGLFYADYFPRTGKRGGAWMSNFREQAGDVRPLIYNVASFTKPAGDMPSLLTLDEVETMFHEFGHALHGMLTKCNYLGVSGTNVAQDFVELPSQIMEHWAVEPEVLKVYAKHYKTGEVIPDELIRKIQDQNTFNQGFMTTELLAAALLDMELHNLTDTASLDVVAFEKAVMDKLGLIPEIAPRYRATYLIISLAVMLPDITVICGRKYWMLMLLKLSKNMDCSIKYCRLFPPECFGKGWDRGSYGALQSVSRCRTELGTIA